MDLSRLSTQELAAELARRQQDAASAAVNADDARDEVAVLQRQLAEAQRGQDKPACEIDLTAIKARNAARTPGSYTWLVQRDPLARRWPWLGRLRSRRPDRTCRRDP